MDTLSVILAASCCLSVLLSILALIESRYIPLLSSLRPEPPTKWPFVSLVIPACNEEKKIRDAMTTLQNIDYPSYEVIAINDRSTDRTGEILEQLAQENSSLKVVHIEQLPDNWLGKVHAMHVGTQQAQGDYLVFIDADVHLAPDALQKIMSLTMEKQLDHLTILPGLRKGTFALECLLSSFAGLFVLLTGAGAVNRGNRKKYAGAGAFMMVRRALFEQTEGWPWLRLEIADDIGLAYLMNRHGAKSFVLQGKETLKLEWYANVPEMIRGMEKNTFAAICRFSLIRAFAIILVTSTLWLSPFVALLTPAWPFSLLVLVSNLITAGLGPTLSERRLPSLLSWFCIPILIYMVIRSTLCTLKQRGVTWRGTHYSIEQLRKGQRVKI